MVRRYKENEVQELVNILKNDGVISIPTDTVYGVCARISSEKAYNKLVDVKKRPKNKSFPVMCADEEQIKSIAIVDSRAEEIIHAFMPGPITLILKKKSNLPAYVTNGRNTIAVRLATSKIIEELIRKTESPIFLTSANKSGETEWTNLDDIEKTCSHLDGMLEGNVIFGEASTIVDCTTDEIRILRNGPISMEQILKVIKKGDSNGNMD